MTKPFRKLSDFDSFINNLYTPNRTSAPFYTDFADYNTNSKSYYDDLSRKARLFEILAHRIWEYDEELAQRFEEWDKLIENFPEDVKRLLEQWLEDGTLKDIINKEIFKDLNDLITALSIRTSKNELDIIDLQNEDKKIYNRFNGKFDEIHRKSNKSLYQTLLMNLDLGNESNPLFEGSYKANQGLAYIKHQDKEYLFTRSRVKDSGWSENEETRITMYELSEEGLSIKPIEISENLRIGHQGISAYIENDEIVLITSVYNNKGYAKIKWRGNETCQKDVQEFILLKPNDTPNDRYSMFYNCTPSVDKTGQYLILACSTTMPSPLRYTLVYDRYKIECEAVHTNAQPVTSFKINPAPFPAGNVVQDVANDDNFIYIFTGYGNYYDPMNISTYNYNGEYVGYMKVDLSKNKFTDEDVTNNNVVIEPEGLTIRGDNLIAQCVTNYKEGGCADSSCQVNLKHVYEISTKKLNSRSESVNYVSSFDAPSGMHFHSNSSEITYGKGTEFNINSYDTKEMKEYNQIAYSSQHLLALSDAREGADNEQRVLIGGYYKENEQYAIIRSDRSNELGSGINLETAKATRKGTITFITPKYRYYLNAEDGSFTPSEKSKQNIGSSAYSWNNGYIDNLQTTSDKRYKKYIKDSDLGLEFINKLRPVKYQYKDGKRNHYGIIAQELKEVMDDLNVDFGGYQDHSLNTNSEDDKLTVGYIEFIAPLIKSVQELSQTVKEQQKEIDELKQQLK